MRTLLFPFALLLALLTASPDVFAQQIRILPGGDYFDGIGGQGPIQGGPGVVFWVQGPIRVPAGKKLTMQQVTFKFNDGTGIQVDGALDARGYFTSIHDDKIVGDTNQNGGATVPAPGNWWGITFTSRFQASTVQGVIRYAGRGGRGGVEVSVSTPGPDLNLSELTVIDGRGPGFRLGSARVILYRCNAIDNAGYAFEGSWPHLDRVAECTARGNALGDFILRTGNRPDWPAGAVTRHYTAAMTVNGSGVFVCRDHIVIPKDGRFSLEAGSILKMSARQRIVVNGDLTLRGSAAKPIVVTSLADDVGGDTNKDGAATSPKAGDWGSIYSQGQVGKATVLEHVDLRYAGSYFNASIVNSARDMTMRNVIVRDSSTGGVRFLGNRTRGTHVVTDCRFERVPGLVFDTIAFDSLPACTGNVHGPGSNRAISVEGLCRRNTRIDIRNVPERVMHLMSSLSPAAGVTATIGAGLALKCQRSIGINDGFGTLVVDGSPSAPVAMSSILDDSVLGDTNGDGNATSPTPGSWTGVRLNRTTASALRFCRVAYAGFGVLCQSPNATIQSVRVDNCSLSGFRLSNFRSCSSIIARGCQRSGLELFWSSSSPRRDIAHATLAYNGQYGMSHGSGASGNYRLVNSIVWKNASGAFNPLVPQSSVHTTCGGFPNVNGNFVADPLFADQQILGPYTNSPCLNRGELAAGVAAAMDYRGNSRVTDWDYSGNCRPDLGAIELTNGQLQDDRPYGVEIGDTVTFRTVTISPRDAGVVVYLLGFEDARVFHPQFGMLNAGLATLFPLTTVATGAAAPLPIPNNGALAGVRFAVQGLNVPLRDVSKGNFTRIYRGHIH